MSKNMSTITQTNVHQSMADHNNKSKLPMKVLLVNTMPKQHTQMQTAPTTRNKVDIIPIPMDQTQQHPPTIKSQTTHNIPPPPTPTVKSGRRVVKRKATGQTLSIPGMKSMLTSLIRTQREANALTKERLQLDTEKFKYEKKVFDEVLGIIPILKQIGSQFLNNSNPNNTQQPNQSLLTQQQPSSTLQCNGHDPTVAANTTEEEDEEEEVMEVTT